MNTSDFGANVFDDSPTPATVGDHDAPAAGGRTRKRAPRKKKAKAASSEAPVGDEPQDGDLDSPAAVTSSAPVSTEAYRPAATDEPIPPRARRASGADDEPAPRSRSSRAEPTDGEPADGESADGATADGGTADGGTADGEDAPRADGSDTGEDGGRRRKRRRRRRRGGREDAAREPNRDDPGQDDEAPTTHAAFEDEDSPVDEASRDGAEDPDDHSERAPRGREDRDDREDRETDDEGSAADSDRDNEDREKPAAERDRDDERGGDFDRDGRRRRRRRRGRRDDDRDEREDSRGPGPLSHGIPDAPSRPWAPRAEDRAAVRPPVEVPTPESELRGTRVAVLIDLAFLLERARERDAEIAWGRVVTALGRRRHLVRAIAYATPSTGDSLRSTLRGIGVELQTVSRPSALSVAIAVDAISLATRVDTIVLIPPADDLEPIARALRGMGVRLESADFIEEASKSESIAQGHHHLGAECLFEP